MLYLILLSPFILFVSYYWLKSIRRRRLNQKRKTLFNSEFSSEWRGFLLDDFPLYRRLPKDLQRKLEGHINVFLDEKLILGRNELEITDRIRVMIAAQACILIVNKPNDYYPGFTTILVYPDTYQVAVSQQEGAVQSHVQQSRLGESWHRGPVVLTWENILNGAKEDKDGHNVVMHEFAHKLDEENVAMDGLPVLSSSSAYKHWAHVLTKEYQLRQQKLLDNKKDVIDSYGASSPAEFFAVVTETFFERPKKLQQLHPELYKEFERYYMLDPTEWEG